VYEVGFENLVLDWLYVGKGLYGNVLYAYDGSLVCHCLVFPLRPTSAFDSRDAPVTRALV
jgi:hypothetical protein